MQPHPVKHPKILFVARVPSTAAAFILPFAKKLRERGNEVEFAFGPGAMLREVEESGFRFHLLSLDKMSRSFGNVRVVRQLRAIIKEGRFDLVHTYSPVIGLYGRVAAHLAKAPVVVHSVIGSLLATGVPLSHRLLYVTSEMLTSWMVDLFITLNEADTKALIRYRLASAEKVVTLNYEYGVNLRRFNPACVDQKGLASKRAELGLTVGIPVIGFIGRMIGAKGILDLYEAFRMLREKGIRAKLLFLGDVLSTDKDIESAKRVRDLAQHSGFANDVVFPGLQMDVPFYISLMDVVVHPTHHEGFPRIPVEAGAMEKPSVCTAVSGADMAVDEGETGFIVPIKDPSSLAHAIERLITNPTLLQKMGKKARERVVELFDEEKIVDQQIRIYEDLFRRMEKNLII
jgi:glycosyltransferase involved in cell wall biosynthesis